MNHSFSAFGLEVTHLLGMTKSCGSKSARTFFLKLEVFSNFELSSVWFFVCLVPVAQTLVKDPVSYEVPECNF